MLESLTKFEFERNFWQAIGFYIVYFLIGFVAVMVLYVIAFLAISTSNNASSIYIGGALAILYSIVISAFIIYKKNRMGVLDIVIVLIAGILAFFGGILLGLIPAAYLTTVKCKSKENSITSPNPADTKTNTTTITSKKKRKRNDQTQK